jgi:hypothetical protein
MPRRRSLEISADQQMLGPVTNRRKVAVLAACSDCQRERDDGDHPMPLVQSGDHNIMRLDIGPDPLSTSARRK